MQIELEHSSPESLREIARFLQYAADSIERTTLDKEAERTETQRSEEGGTQPASSSSLDSRFPLSALAEFARAQYAHRLQSNRIFGFEVSSDPAWNMLLDLFIQRVEGKRVSVSSACVASAAPMTTALRYLDMLEERGLLARVPDLLDKRRILVELAPDALLKMATHLSDGMAALRKPKSPKLGIFEWG